MNPIFEARECSKIWFVLKINWRKVVDDTDFYYNLQNLSIIVIDLFSEIETGHWFLLRTPKGGKVLSVIFLKNSNISLSFGGLLNPLTSLSSQIFLQYIVLFWVRISIQMHIYRNVFIALGISASSKNGAGYQTQWLWWLRATNLFY